MSRTSPIPSKGSSHPSHANILSISQRPFRLLFTVICVWLACFSGVQAQSDTVPFNRITPKPTVLPTRAPAQPPTPTLDTVQPTLPITRPPTLAPVTPSLQPSDQPSISPKPTGVPSQAPTSFPTFNETKVEKTSIRQGFELENCGLDVGTQTCEFNETNKEIFADVLVSLLNNSQVETSCAIDDSAAEQGIDGTETVIVALDYSCEYSSNIVDVTEYPRTLLALINQDGGIFLDLLRMAQLPVLDLEPANLFFRVESTTGETTSPTTSAAPSENPSMSPTSSFAPTVSFAPTLAPSTSPTMPAPTAAPNSEPVIDPTSGGLSNALLGVIIAAAVLSGLCGVYFFIIYRTRRKRSISTALPIAYTNPQDYSHGADDATDHHIVKSPTTSLLSNKSFVSMGESGIGDESCDENDGTIGLQHEFSQIKIDNINEIQSPKRKTTTEVEGIKSHALTSGVMGDDVNHSDVQELLWGCDFNPSGTEIEASALFEISDWLKRNESASGERRRAFVLEILNKMVRSVRFGVLRAEVATRTIHESAALLGVELAEELPTTTVIISGMRKTTTAADMIRALSEFGDIDAAAVASNRRGFGIVRFRRQKSVERALSRYRSGEIVILDVSIQMKVIGEEN